MSQKVTEQIIELLETLEKMGADLPMATSKGKSFIPHELVIYATNLSDNDVFWARVPKDAQPLRAKLHSIILKHNQAIL